LSYLFIIIYLLVIYSFTVLVICLLLLLPVTCMTRGADLAEDGPLVLCPDCSQYRMSVFGTGVYASVSSVCGAAIHRFGSIFSFTGPQAEGTSTGYMSSYAHGVQSQALSHWTSSFSLSSRVEPTGAGGATEGSDYDWVTHNTQVLHTHISSPSFCGNHTGFDICCSLCVIVYFLCDFVYCVQCSPQTEFLLTNYTHPKSCCSAIKEVAYLGGDTNTGNKHTNTGERREAGPPRVMVVLIDGWPSDDLEQAAMLARESDKDFVQKAVCKDNAHFSYSIPSWFSTTKHVKPLTQRLCSLDGLLCSKTCYNSVNIGFLIDGSSSIGDSNFRMMLDFLAGIARSFDISDIGAIVTYDQRLERISYMSGGTATGAGITYAIQNLFSPTSSSSSSDDGLDRVGTPHHHITDGQSYDDVQHHHLLCGCGLAPLEDLKAMASEPKEGHTFFTRDFIGLAEIVPAVVRGICRDFNDKN
uniref:Cochlin n=1 Tax=Sphaeramia orbicularis TaxID=375764 RepID=A0A673C729_9TELE